jgi:hypothetical protein
MKCRDKTMYPVHDGVLNKIFGYTSATLSINIISGLYRELALITNCIPHKFLVVYPTDYLQKDEWKTRIDNVQTQASLFFTDNDWDVITFEPELDTSNYWAHYSFKSRQVVWNKIADKLRIEK